MRTVNICGIPHMIEYCPDKFDGDGTHFGQITYSKALIQINSDASPQLQEEALCHEIIHGIFFHLGMDKEAGDEELVQKLANAINQSFTPKVKED